MSTEIIDLVYIVAAILFIVGLKFLGSPATARKGNVISSIGMAIAVIATLFSKGLNFELIIGGLAIGGLIGAVVARKVEMTSMPEMVALFNGFGGLASLFVGWSVLMATASPEIFFLVTVFLSILIGGLTFTGSLLAYGKLLSLIHI